MELVELNLFFGIDFHRSSLSVNQDWQSIKMTLKVNFAPSTDTDWPEYKHAKTKKCSIVGSHIRVWSLVSGWGTLESYI